MTSIRRLTRSSPRDPRLITASAARAGLKRWRNSPQRRAELSPDVGQGYKYRAQNAALPPPKPGEKRIVFVGDSITELWPLPERLHGAEVINRGIGGQTTRQILARFDQDVLALKPTVVVLMAGTNDIAGNMGRVAKRRTLANIATMAARMKEAGIHVVIGAVTPVRCEGEPEAADFFVSRPPERIVQLDKRLAALCRKSGYVYADYHTEMVGPDGLLKPGLADDGLHPNASGYSLMNQVTEAATAKSLGIG